MRSLGLPLRDIVRAARVLRGMAAADGDRRASSTFAGWVMCCSTRRSNILVGTTLFLLSGAAPLTAEEFCDLYAGQAVEYAEEAARHPTCALTGPEWDTDRDAHLAWCEALQPPELATVENAKRHAALITCLMSVTAGAPSSSVTNATDSDGADGKIGGESDPQHTGSETPKP